MYDSSNGELIQEKNLDTFKSNSLAKGYSAQLHIQEDNLKLYEIFSEETNDSQLKQESQNRTILLKFENSEKHAQFLKVL